MLRLSIAFLVSALRGVNQKEKSGDEDERVLSVFQLAALLVKLGSLHIRFNLRHFQVTRSDAFPESD
ncbi:unnamed protein product [Dracunculus medinensis]|uniref:Secreted protein n=1 Tax=Dracunculus medinensis TaxID=318479 RepID=A0A0N4U747_DRAME|nr:unnamed protein product [Dracunculus medinensis]